MKIKRLQSRWKSFTFDFMVCLPYLIKFFLIILFNLSVLSDIYDLPIDKCEPMRPWSVEYIFHLQFFDRQERFLSPKGNSRSRTTSLVGPDIPADTIICLPEPYCLPRAKIQVQGGSLTISRYRCTLVGCDTYVNARPDPILFTKESFMIQINRSTI